MVFSEIHRLLAAGVGTWQLAFWRDRTKEADFLLDATALPLSSLSSILV
jgi:hypothetical protein